MAVPGKVLAAEASEPSLYVHLLGSAWDGLPPIVRRLHLEGSATGRFAIRRGRGLLATVVGWLCRFPAPGEDVPTRLVVRRDGPVQRWERTFAGHGLASVQRAWRDGWMAERMGPVECAFRLRPVERGLVYDFVGAWLCLGVWRLRLPRLFAPHVEGTTTEEPGGMHVRVSIRQALAGELLTYEGLIRPEESP
jgi:hypothetical protein